VWKVRLEVAHALVRLERHEPVVAALLRRCISQFPGRRPSPKALIRKFKRLHAEEEERSAGNSLKNKKRRAKKRKGKKRSNKEQAAAGRLPVIPGENGVPVIAEELRARQRQAMAGPGGVLPAGGLG
jgi:hypothetical protein